MPNACPTAGTVLCRMDAMLMCRHSQRACRRESVAPCVEYPVVTAIVQSEPGFVWTVHEVGRDGSYDRQLDGMVFKLLCIFHPCGHSVFSTAARGAAREPHHGPARGRSARAAGGRLLHCARTAGDARLEEGVHLRVF